MSELTSVFLSNEVNKLLGKRGMGVWIVRIDVLWRMVSI